jgi:hypothetical protein
VATKTKTNGGDVITKVARALEKPVTLTDLLAAMGSRDRVNVERHLAAAETESSKAHSTLWTRLVRDLATLSSLTVQTTGQQALSFYIPDGKHRQQVFALEDQRDGKIIVYSEDVLAQAMKAGIVTSPQRGAVGHGVGGAAGQAIQIEALTAQNTPNPSPFYKHMLGWNRKALRITLPVEAAEPTIKATEQICAISAQRWQDAMLS